MGTDTRVLPRLSALSAIIGRHHLGDGARFFVPRAKLTGDGRQSVNLMPGDGHPQGDFFAGPAVADFQPENGVEPPLDLLRDHGKVHIEVRQSVEQSRIIERALRRFRRCQAGQLLSELFAL